MTDDRDAARRAAYAAIRRGGDTTSAFESYARGFRDGWGQSLDYCGDQLWEAGARSSYADGVMAGRLESHKSADEQFTLGYRSGLEDSASTVRAMRQRLAEYEDAR
jgi:hypothetical protein